MTLNVSGYLKILSLGLYIVLSTTGSLCASTASCCTEAPQEQEDTWKNIEIPEEDKLMAQKIWELKRKTFDVIEYRYKKTTSDLPLDKIKETDERLNELNTKIGITLKGSKYAPYALCATALSAIGALLLSHKKLFTICTLASAACSAVALSMSLLFKIWTRERTTLADKVICAMASCRMHSKPRDLNQTQALTQAEADDYSPHGLVDLLTNAARVKNPTEAQAQPQPEHKTTHNTKLGTRENQKITPEEPPYLEDILLKTELETIKNIPNDIAPGKRPSDSIGIILKQNDTPNTITQSPYHPHDFNTMNALYKKINEAHQGELPALPENEKLMKNVNTYSLKLCTHFTPARLYGDYGLCSKWWLTK